MTIILHGYQYSVYVRIARMVLFEKDVEFQHVEVNPFADPIPLEYLTLHPFGRVPTLECDGFVVYESSAITRYIDEAFDGKILQPVEPKLRARMNQVISIIDSYGYWPMVRQVFAQRVFWPRFGEQSDENEIQAGLDSSLQVLSALEALIEDSDFVVGKVPSLADFHLAPMIAYFVAAPEGKTMFSKYPRLSRWWALMAQRESLAKTDPGLPS